MITPKQGAWGAHTSVPSPSLWPSPQGRFGVPDPQSSSEPGGRWQPTGGGSLLSISLPAHHTQVAATRAKVVKGEVGPFEVAGPLDLHWPLLHKNLSKLCPVGPEAGLWGQPCWSFCHTGPNTSVPVLGECYHHWLLRKSLRWGNLPAPSKSWELPLPSFSLGAGGGGGGKGMDSSSILGSAGMRGGPRGGMTVTVYGALPVSLACCVISWNPHKTCHPRPGV